MTGAVFRDTVRFTSELDAGTLTVKKVFNGNKYITTKYKYKYLGSKYKYKYFTYKYKYKYIKNVLKYKYKYQVPHLCPLHLQTRLRHCKNLENTNSMEKNGQRKSNMTRHIAVCSQKLQTTQDII